MDDTSSVQLGQAQAGLMSTAQQGHQVGPTLPVNQPPIVHGMLQGMHIKRSVARHGEAGNLTIVLHQVLLGPGVPDVTREGAVGRSSLVMGPSIAWPHATGPSRLWSHASLHHLFEWMFVVDWYVASVSIMGQEAAHLHFARSSGDLSNSLGVLLQQDLLVTLNAANHHLSQAVTEEEMEGKLLPHLL
ncbi:MAG: hypothetical protein FRX49_02253 [Trebouxia sp. A1-2]|nr:MAG: hypothetical protein FRX49_02253 [Trebouxia sp. A1-2]